MRCSRRWASSSRFSAAEELQPLLEFGADVAHRLLHPALGGHVVRGRVDAYALELADHLAAQRIDLVQRLDLVAEELDAHRAALFVGREDLDDVAAHAEGAAMEVVVVALVLDVDQLAQHAVALDGLALLEKRQHLEVDLGLAQAVDARDRRDDQDVVALEQGLGGRVAQLVDLVVDAGVLLDVGVGRGDVGLGLVVVVVGDEVTDRVVREQALELVVELRGEGLVGCDHQRGLVHVGHHVGHREGLARTGDAEQHLLAHAVAHVAGQRLDRGRLIALRTIAGDQPEDPFFAARQARARNKFSRLAPLPATRARRLIRRHSHVSLHRTWKIRAAKL